MRTALSVLIVASVLSATPVFGQARETGFIRGIGGVTFGTETSSVFGGSVGVNVTSALQIIGEAGRVQNALPKSIREDLDSLADFISFSLGVPVKFEARIPAFYGLGGVRYQAPVRGRVRPFVDAGIGAARLSADLAVRVAGISVPQTLIAQAKKEAGLEDVTKFLLGLGGGVNVALTNVIGVDFGYRYFRIFTEEPRINNSQAFGGVTFSFR